jgi:flagellar L-ring protein precursor FlgH
MSKFASNPFQIIHPRALHEVRRGGPAAMLPASSQRRRMRLFPAAGLLAMTCLATGAVRAESLWPVTGSERSMFADRKASSTGDILTIVIAESAVAQSTQSKTSERDSSVDDAIAKFVYTGLGTHKGELPSLSLAGKASYSGGGAVNNSQSLTARAAVLVSDVLPNGNLVIEGVRIVTFSGETQYVVLHGVVRRDDIARDNTIVSTNIADAHVEFYAEGQLTDAQKRGWLTKVYEKLRPL